MSFPRFPDSLRSLFQKLGLLPAHLYLSQDLPKWVEGIFNPDGSIKPASLSDAAAKNHSIYYSTTASKIVYKDNSGTVHALY